jgi:hypothetical protein
MTAGRVPRRATGQQPRVLDRDNSCREAREALSDELRKLGWVEGTTILIDHKEAAGHIDRLPAAVPSRDGMPIAPLRCRFPAKINGPSAL